MNKPKIWVIQKKIYLCDRKKSVIWLCFCFFCSLTTSGLISINLESSKDSKSDRSLLINRFLLRPNFVASFMFSKMFSFDFSTVRLFSLTLKNFLGEQWGGLTGLGRGARFYGEKSISVPQWIGIVLTIILNPHNFFKTRARALSQNASDLVLP